MISNVSAGATFKRSRQSSSSIPNLIIEFYLLFCSCLAVFLLALEAPAPQIVGNSATARGIAQLRVVPAVRVWVLLQGQLMDCVCILFGLVDRINALVIFEKLDLVQFWHASAQQVTVFHSLFNLNLFVLSLDECLNQLVPYGLLSDSVRLGVNLRLIWHFGTFLIICRYGCSYLCALFFRCNWTLWLRSRSISLLLHEYLLRLGLVFDGILLFAPAIIRSVVVHSIRATWGGRLLVGLLFGLVGRLNNRFATLLLRLMSCFWRLHMKSIIKEPNKEDQIRSYIEIWVLNWRIKLNLSNYILASNIQYTTPNQTTDKDKNDSVADARPLGPPTLLPSIRRSAPRPRHSRRTIGEASRSNSIQIWRFQMQHFFHKIWIRTCLIQFKLF